MKKRKSEQFILDITLARFSTYAALRGCIYPYSWIYDEGFPAGDNLWITLRRELNEVLNTTGTTL